MVFQAFQWYAFVNLDDNWFYIFGRHHFRCSSLYGLNVMFPAHSTSALGRIQQQIL